MTQIKKYIVRIFAVLILALLLIFVFYNKHDVMFYFPTMTDLVIPLYQIMIASFLTGVFLTLLVVLPGILKNKLKLRKELKNQAKQNKKA